MHTKFSSFQDLELISQVELWAITRSVFEQFGADVESQAALQKPTEVLKLAERYDQWLQTWSGMLVFDNRVRQGSVLELYFHSAKLYLYSHIYRGNTRPHSTIDSSTISDLRQRFRESALSVVRIMLNGETAIIALPSYFSTMLAFATVTLVKTLREDDAENSSHKQEIVRLLQKLTDVLHATQLPRSPSHPLRGIAKGLEHAYDGLTNDAAVAPDALPDIEFDESLFMEDLWNVDFADFGDNWMGFDEH